MGVGLPNPSPTAPNQQADKASYPLPMGEEFACSAARLSGHAAVLLGWVPDTFWNSTPAELASVLRALVGDAPGAVDLGALMEMFPDG